MKETASATNQIKHGGFSLVSSPSGHAHGKRPSGQLR